MTQTDTNADGRPGPAADIAAMLAMMVASGAPPMSAGTPADGRTAFRLLAVDLRPPEAAVDGVTVADLEVAGMAARSYRPDGVTGALPLVAFFHGGGFVIGDLDTHDPLCRLIARECGAVVVALDYPLAPEHPFPAAWTAAVAATRELAGRADELGADGRMAVAGDSAGANLAAHVAQECRDLDLVGQLLVYPKTDALGDYPSMRDNAVGYFLDVPTMDWFTGQLIGAGGDLSVAADPRLSPLHGDLAGLAPALVATAEYDPLRDEGEAYAEALRAAGVFVDLQRYDGQIHGFVNMDHIAPSSKAAMDDVLSRFRALLRP